DRVLGVHVYAAHEPSRFVGADRQHHEIERATTPADLLELGIQRGVSGEVNANAIGLERPPTPQRLAAIAEAAGAEVLRRNARRRIRECRHRLPPIELA